MNKEDLLAYEEKNAKRFWAEAGNDYLTRHFWLTPESRVMDVGGYRGDWTSYIASRYQSFVDVYEPLPVFYRYLSTRFSDNPKVRVFNFGLENENHQARIAVMEDSSSLYYPFRDDAPTVEVRDVSEITKETGAVDLMALNCEGAEYKILRRLVETDQIRWIKNIIVQFHAFYPDAERERDQIRAWLRGTHDELFAFPFCWEAWRARRP